MEFTATEMILILLTLAGAFVVGALWELFVQPILDRSLENLDKRKKQ